MFGNGRKTIGVFVTQVYREFQDILSRGICKRAKELGFNVAFFTNFLGYDELQYEYGERIIANLPWYEDLDGIIMLPDTMFVEGFKDNILENISKYSNCPVVSVRQKIDGFYNVLIDDDTVLEDIINHFIKDHGYRKINFLTGPKENKVSIQRLESYKRVLAEYNIPFEEERIYYGDFWRHKGKDAVEFWLSNPSRIPEAIICANDFMAITVCNTLMEKGISIPHDIAISGCDNIDLAQDFSPSITTAEMPVFDMGIEAVNKIYRHHQNIPQDKCSYLKSKTIIRESCGCKQKNIQGDLLKRRNHIINEVEAKEKDISNNAYMSIDLTGVTSLDGLTRNLGSYTYMNSGFSAFYLCLVKGWEAYGSIDTRYFAGKNLEVVMEAGNKNGQWLEKKKIKKGDLLPAEYMDESPQFFYFNILHHQEKCYGYTAISFYEPQAYKLSYLGWLVNICNALENIKIHSEMNRLVYKLEDMYIKDELTGLYNRRGLQSLGQKYFVRSMEKQSGLLVFSADMDNLKYINDNFGHISGDMGIKTVAGALMSASEDDEICIRMGGDEFCVIGLEYDDNKITKFINSFHNSINKFNQDEASGFKVEVSYGYTITIPKEGTILEDYINIADSKMYRQKYEKGTQRLKLYGMKDKL